MSNLTGVASTGSPGSGAHTPAIRGFSSRKAGEPAHARATLSNREHTASKTEIGASEQDKVGSRVYVAGHRGMVGAAIVRRLEAAGVSDILARTHRELDLTDARAVDAFFAETRPSRVYLAAAKVGGIQANNSFPAEFIHQNLMIAANIIHAARRNGVERLLFLGSSCIYPRLAPQPIGEEALLTGTLESTNESSRLIRIMQQVQPDELYNLAAQSHVAVSFEEPEYTADSDGIGTLRLLEAIRILGLERKTRFYQASTSEL